MSAGIGEDVDWAERTVGAGGASELPKPLSWTALPEDWGRFSPTAVPLPKPVLATTPATPFAPPLPFPCPPPEGKSKDPTPAMFTAFPWSDFVGSPLGSPKPPVCTWDEAIATVGTAEVPVENVFVLTTLGIGGGELIGRGSDFRGAMLTVGAGASSIFMAFGCGAGSRNAVSGGTRAAAERAFGSCRKGWA